MKCMNCCLLLAVCLTGLGCQPSPVATWSGPDVPHALWDPGYTRNGGMLIYGGKGWTEQMIEALLWRQNYTDYMGLVSMVLRHAPSADAMIIVEFVPGNPRDDRSYWWALLVQEGTQYVCYANAPVPLRGKGQLSQALTWPGMSTLEDVEEAKQPKRPAPVTASGKTIHSAASALLEACRNIDGQGTGIWTYDGYDDTKTIWEDGLFLEATGWFVHVYERQESRAISLSACVPMIDPEVVYGSTSLVQLRGRETPTVGELDEADWHPEDLNGKSRELILTEYTKSRPVRIVLGGMLRTVASAGQP